MFFKILFLFFTPFFSLGLNIPYLSLDIPEEWPCEQFSAYWICSHKDEESFKPVFVIITASMENKNLEQSFKESKASSKKNINNHLWLESLKEHNIAFEAFKSRHNETACCEEFPFTYYINVGFHAPKSIYTRYASLFLRAIRSFNLSRNAALVRQALEQENPEDLKKMKDYVQNILFEESPPIEDKKNSKWLYFLFCIVCAFFLFYIFFRAKKRKLNSSA